MQRVVGTPVVVQDFERLSELLLSLLILSCHVIRLDEDRLELDSLAVMTLQSSIELLSSLLRHTLG